MKAKIRHLWMLAFVGSSLLGFSSKSFAQYQDAVMADNSNQSRSSLSIGLGFSYGRGNGGWGWGGGAMPIGGIPGWGGIANTCMISGGGWGWGGGGGFYGPPPFATPPFMPPARPALPPIPPPAPIVPPHVAMANMGWGPGWGSLPGPAIPGYNYGVNCIPCVAGVGIPGGLPPVAGGPNIGIGLGMGGMGLGFGPGGMGMGGGMFMGGGIGQRSEIADITWATAFGLGMQASNVFPVAYPRWGYTGIPTPYWTQTGERDSTLIDRDTHGAP